MDFSARVIRGEALDGFQLDPIRICSARRQ
jgi:hypothetical protein